ncbi:MAG: alanine:cation symporter family protein, partial [Bacteroidales bacterium]|nr:alanine:cation symporter family protein [Bacteroidales bacterium]
QALGVASAICLGGYGAVFWMWVIAIVGGASAYVESTLAQMYKEEDTLYGGFRGGPAHYIHAFFTKGKEKRHHWIAVAFALSGLLCWCGVSQVISNSVSSAFQNAFGIAPIVSTVVLVALAAVVVLRKKTTVKVLDVIVPIMAAFYFLIAVVVIVKNAGLLPAVFTRILEEAFGIRQVVAGGFGAALMNGVKRGLFSNETLVKKLSHHSQHAIRLMKTKLLHKLLKQHSFLWQQKASASKKKSL